MEKNTLIIDCSAGMNLILVSAEKVFEQLDSNQKRHTDELLLSVDKLLMDANLTIKDIDNLCVTLGPGSFTGIRVAISICKGLSFGIHADIYTASNFDAYAFNQTGNSIFVLDAFSDFVYARIITEGKCVDDCLHVSDLYEKIKNEYSRHKIFVQNEKLLNLFAENNISAELAKNDLLGLFKNKIAACETTTINQISPIYLRASQAEIERNKKLKE